METNITFGEITLDQLLEAQRIISKVVKFVIENRDSDDGEKKKLAKMALASVVIDDMMKRPVISSLVREEAEKIEKKKNGKDATDSTQTFSFSIRPTSDKS